MTIDDASTLEEAISALREEMLKELAESLPVNPTFRDAFHDSQDLA